MVDAGPRPTPVTLAGYRTETLGDILVFGRETRGLDDVHLAQATALVTIPIWGQVRSLNLANAATTLLYEALRQTGSLPEGRPG